MILTVKSTSLLKGKVLLPASKSYSIRAFIIASCGGNSIILNPSNCDDSKVSQRVIKCLGSELKRLKNTNNFQIKFLRKSPSSPTIDVGESGTVLRFLLPLLALRKERFVVTGKGSLRGRPNYFLTKAIRNIGGDIKGKGKNESIPIRIKEGSLKGGNIQIDGTLSSQFISALLITCPQLKEDSVLRLKGKKLVSQDYIKMTLQVLNKCGIKIIQKDTRTYFIKGNQVFKGLKNFYVPSDYGLAAFLMGAASLIRSNVCLRGYFRDDLIQADGKILDFLKLMGVKYQKTNTSIKLKGPFELKGGVFSLKDCPDLVPIMAILALFAKGKTRLCDIKHARVKESDRISDLRKELLKINADVKEKENELIIIPKKKYKEGRILDPHNDHRLAMAFSVLGLKVPVKVKDMECCRKSYPDFVKDFKTLNAQAIIKS